MFAGIVALVCAVAPLLTALVKSSHDTKKLTRAQVVDGVFRLAHAFVEGEKAKRGPLSPISPAQARAMAADAAVRYAKSKGVTLTQRELDAAEVGWELLSTAAKAIAPSLSRGKK